MRFSREARVGLWVVAMLDRMGVHPKSFGDSTGVLGYLSDL
jgi:hypothetical protein